MGQMCQAGGTGPGGAHVLSVVRSAAWNLGAEEDVWQVEVLPTTTMAELKVKIEELYDVPSSMQKLCRADTPTEAGLEDGVQVSSLSGQRVYLLPNDGQSPEDEEDVTAFADMMLLGAAQENMEVNQAMEESLRGVTYKVSFERPRDAGGQAAGKTISMDLDALALVGDVQQMVEVELFGGVDKEPAFLVFEGAPLPPHAPIHFCGIENGKTIVVAKELPPIDPEAAMLAGLAEG